MHTILDLDLDFFGWPTLHYQEHGERPIDDDFKHLADETEVRNFLERECHLSTAKKLPGRQFVEHVDAFVTWREWIQSGKLIAPFAVVHVDAHADLGAGLGTYLVKRYIETKLLALPLEQRAHPWFDESKGVNSADYLIAAVANRWISRLTYVYPDIPASYKQHKQPATREIRTFLTRTTDCDDASERPGDLPPWCFQNGDYKHIQLAHRRNVDDAQPVHLEAAVPFDWKKNTQFEFSGFTHMVVAQSPKYIPESSDHLLSVICEYLVPC